METHVVTIAVEFADARMPSAFSCELFRGNALECQRLAVMNVLVTSRNTTDGGRAEPSTSVVGKGVSVLVDLVPSRCATSSSGT